MTSMAHYDTECYEYHDVVRDYTNGPCPRIIVLCGSTKFRALFDIEMRRLTFDGHIVIGPGVWGHNGDPVSDDQKEQLDSLHFRKIELADQVHIIDHENYIGESTRNEIEHARKLGITVTYFSEV